MIRVVATGAFEVIHPGHLMYLEESKKLGDELVVILATDNTVRKRKKTVVVPQDQRLHVVSSLKPVDKAIVGDEENWFKTIKEVNPDIISLGHDQDHDLEELEQKLQENDINCKVVRIAKYWNGEFNSSNKIKKMNK